MVEVWVRPGTFVGFNNSSVGWTQVTRVSATSAGSGNPTPVVITSPFTITAGSTVGVYVTTSAPGGSGTINYINGSGGPAPPGTFVWDSDAFLTITEGYGVCGYFSGGVNTPRNFSGSIHYTTGGFNCGDLNPQVLGQWGTTDSRCGTFASNASAARYESTVFAAPPLQVRGSADYSYEVQFVNNRPVQPTAATSIFFAGSPIPLRSTAQWWDRAIAFNIAGNGKYSIFRYNGVAKPVPLQAWTVPVGVVFNAPPASNTLRVDVIGPNLEFYINNVLVRTLPNLYPLDQFGMGFVRSLAAAAPPISPASDWMEILNASVTAVNAIRAPARVSPAMQLANDAANAERVYQDPLFATKKKD